MATVINSFSIMGIHAYLIYIEVDTLYGQPCVSIVGLADQAVKESKERLEASIINCGFDFPKMKIVINLSPSDLKKRGSHFDLGMAIGLLIQSKQLIAKEIESFAIMGEVYLNGILRPCSGILPTILPSMSEEEALEVTKIYSVAGLIKNKGKLITKRPFRAPHHNASMNSLIGGGNFAMPGEISFAHNGILFLDEIAEFNKKTPDLIKTYCELDNDSMLLLRQAFSRFKYSARTLQKTAVPFTQPAALCTTTSYHNPIGKEIIKLLGNSSFPIELIRKELKFSLEEIQEALFLLELDSQVEYLGGMVKVL